MQILWPLCIRTLECRRHSSHRQAASAEALPADMQREGLSSQSWSMAAASCTAPPSSVSKEELTFVKGAK